MRIRVGAVMLGLLVFAAVTGAALAGTGGSAPQAAITVKSLGNETFVRSGGFYKGALATLRWSRLTITVKSGDSVTFEHADKTQDPHTVTIATTKAQLPTDFDEAAPPTCKPCAVAAKHGGGNGPPKHWVLNAGKPGLDTLGDSIALAPKGPHKTATVVVSAPAGTTLYYVCAIHPWMQGEIKVT
jgi:plastocyanin